MSFSLSFLPVLKIMSLMIGFSSTITLIIFPREPSSSSILRLAKKPVDQRTLKSRRISSSL
jgi:hypothetical protein